MKTQCAIVHDSEIMEIVMNTTGLDSGWCEKWTPAPDCGQEMIGIDLHDSTQMCVGCVYRLKDPK